MLKERTEEMKKQINNIYEILEFLTNESKKNNLNESNDDEQKDIQQPNSSTRFIYSKTIGITEKPIRREKNQRRNMNRLKS